MIKKFLSNNQDLALVLGLITILMVLFIPIPAFILDLLIITNFSLGLSILLMTFYVDKPVAFSTFPSLLLVATLFRLSLNVAATRLILTSANAGEVIGAIGAFAVQGSFVIGLVVFFILVIVQYVVVTAGAQRVSEVAARFVLDSMPGQQMSIDADLNMGLIDQAEAKSRRKELEKEASFYGAMDGASKFVKGDAIAGIIILLINIIAGWIIGIVQMGMDWLQALQTFSLLTIGDGIVTQVPALVISTATGIIVTRSSADERLSAEILRQFGAAPKIPLIVMGVMSVLVVLPGMPKWPILIVLTIAAGIWLLARRNAMSNQAETSKLAAPSQSSTGKDPLKPPPAIEVLFGPSLSEQMKPSSGLLADRIAALRTQQEAATGFSIPAVVFRDGAVPSANDYEVRIHGARHAHATLFPDRVLAVKASKSARPLPGVETRDPAFGLPAVWIDRERADSAERDGYTTVDPITVLMTHVSEIIRQEAPQLLGRSQVVNLLEGVRARQPGLIEELIPGAMGVADVQRILQNLLSEGVSIVDIDRICEALADAGRHQKDPAELTEVVRQKLCNGICQGLRGDHPDLAVLSLNPRIEAQISESVRNTAGKSGFVIDPKLAEHLIRRLVALVDAMMQQNLTPVLLCGPEIRRHLKTFTRRAAPRLSVISVSEVPTNLELRSFDVINME